MRSQALSQSDDLTMTAPAAPAPAALGQTSACLPALPSLPLPEQPHPPPPGRALPVGKSEMRGSKAQHILVQTDVSSVRPRWDQKIVIPSLRLPTRQMGQG